MIRRQGEAARTNAVDMAQRAAKPNDTNTLGTSVGSSISGGGARA